MQNFVIILTLFSGAWAIGNGVLHDIFVIREHKTGYDRELLRLLMDGHILITCGAMYVLAYYLLRQGEPFGVYLCLLAAASLLIYCAMIFRFLKSVLTIVLNLLVVVVCLIELLF